MSNSFVSFEGGPILVGPSCALKNWRGIEGADYESLCALFDADPSLKVTGVPGYEGNCIAVDFGGPGTLRVIRSGRSLVLIRAWHEDPDSDSVYSDTVSAEEPPAVLVGEIDLSGDTIAIAWATEALTGIPASVSEPSVPNIDLAVDGSVLLHPLAKGRYGWRRSEISLPSGSAIRLVLDPR
jgi:hypothetical protein